MSYHTKTVTIFGATGNVGHHVVILALEKGLWVKAFGRNVDKLQKLRSDKLQLIHGEVFDEEEVKAAMKGSDFVISVLGGDFSGIEKVRSKGMKTILSAMQKTGIRRIVALGGSGILENADGKLKMESESFPKEFLPVYQEHRLSYQLLKSSDTDWTYFCAPSIENSAATHHFKMEREKMPQGSQVIPAADLADALLTEALEAKYLKCRVGICQELV